MVYTIDEIKKKAIPIAQTHGVKKLSLFGSYARGNATSMSDIDFYIDDGDITTLLKYFAFVNDLEKSLNCHVDVISTGIQDKGFLENIEKEGILLYEAI